MNKHTAEQIRVEVALLLPTQQAVIAVVLAAGSTLADAIDQSGILSKFDNFCLDPESVGIFGSLTDIKQRLRDGDRVEIYRPLIADPKESRRRRASRPVV